MSNLNEKAVLVSLCVSQWTGRKLDRTATDTVETTHATKHGVGNYHKRLLPGATELKAIEAQASILRKFYRENSLPWCADGSRIIAAHHYGAFLAEFRTYKAAFERAVSEFISVYPSLQADAISALGNLYRPGEYPSATDLASRFGCEIQVMPVPSVADFRIDLSEAERAEFVARMASVEQAAMRDIWERLHATVSKAANTLSTPGAVFRDTLVSNITDICAMLPKLNFANDPALESMRQEVERVTAKMAPEALRTEQAARSESAKALDAITAKMASLMGGN